MPDPIPTTQTPTLDQARSACLADGYEGTPTPEMLALYGWVPSNPLAGVTLTQPVRSPVLLQADLAALVEEAKANNTAPQVIAAILNFANHALAFAKLPLVLLALLLSFTAGAVDLDLSNVGNSDKSSPPFYLLDNTTTTAKTITVPAKYDITLTHSGLKADGSASVAGDYFVVMRAADTMAANSNAGAKALVFVNGFVTCCADDFLQEGANGYTIQVKAVTNTVKIQITLKPRVQKQ